MIRVMLPQHLRTLAKADRMVELDVNGTPTQRSVLDALEAAYPTLRGDDSRSRDPTEAAAGALLRLRPGSLA